MAISNLLFHILKLVVSVNFNWNHCSYLNTEFHLNENTAKTQQFNEDALDE